MEGQRAVDDMDAAGCVSGRAVHEWRCAGIWRVVSGLCCDMYRCVLMNVKV